mgnify:CR=1 FL=1
MALYFLSYDLRKRRDYDKLYEELGRFDAAQVLESLYAFTRINTSSEKLRAHFSRFIDTDDGLIVIKASEWAGRKMTKSPPTPTSWN